MKTNILFILSFILLALSTKAQPVVTQSVYPVPGTSVLNFGTDSFELKEDFRKSGENIFWDFSDLDYLVDSSRLGYLSVEETPYAYLFPNANIAMTFDKEEYQYFKFDDKGYRILGSYAIDKNLGTGVHEVNEDRYYQNTFPMTYGQSNSYTSSDYMEIIDFLLIDEQHSISSIVDAYGTLIVDKDTFYNVLRVKEIGLREGEVIPIHPESKAGNMRNEYVRYQWWADNYKIPILSISENHYTDSKGADRISQSLTYSKEIPMYLEDVSLFPLNLKVYNSADQQMIVTYQSSHDNYDYLELRDLSGRIIKQFENPSMQMESIRKISFNTKGLSQGIYILTVYSGSQKESVKIYVGI